MEIIGKGFLPYSAGKKTYGPTGMGSPNGGLVDAMGYKERDLKYTARRTALQRRLKAIKEKNFASPDVGRQL